LELVSLREGIARTILQNRYLINEPITICSGRAFKSKTDIVPWAESQASFLAQQPVPLWMGSRICDLLRGLTKLAAKPNTPVSAREIVEP
jgi:hypothetical protein